MIGRLRSAAAWTLPCVLVVAALVGCGGGGRSPDATGAAAASGGSRPTLASSVTRVRAELHGIAQAGLVLGDPRAPVSIIEYANLVCATCVDVHRVVVPDVISRYVRTGDASLELRILADGPRSRDLAASAYAASVQGRGWDFVQLAYLRAAATRPAASEARPESAAQLASAIGVDVQRWRRDLRRPAWTTQITAARSVARVAQFSGDPVFLVRRPGHPFAVVTEPGSAAQLEGVVAKALQAAP